LFYERTIGVSLNRIELFINAMAAQRQAELHLYLEAPLIT
jgi:hypothetical protein